MEKTIIFAQPDRQLNNSEAAGFKRCPNCSKLQNQLADMTNLLWSQQIKTQNSDQTQEGEQRATLIQQELTNLRQQYSLLKKKLKQIEKENDQLFSENTMIRRKLKELKNKSEEQNESAKKTSDSSLKQSDRTKQTHRSTDRLVTFAVVNPKGGSTQSIQDNNNEQDVDQNNKNLQQMQANSMFKLMKMKQIQLFVEREKRINLEGIIKQSNEEIGLLKSLLRRRNKIQNDRSTAIMELSTLLSLQ